MRVGYWRGWASSEFLLRERIEDRALLREVMAGHAAISVRGSGADAFQLGDALFDVKTFVFGRAHYPGCIVFIAQREHAAEIFQ